MKPKPLKEKLIFASEITNMQRDTHLLPVFQPCDIKAAVDWLWKEISDEVKKQVDADEDCVPMLSGFFVFDKITEAFEDVTKED